MVSEPDKGQEAVKRLAFLSRLRPLIQQLSLDTSKLIQGETWKLHRLKSFITSMAKSRT